MTAILITGGMGFIGSNFTRYLIKTKPDYKIIVYDKLTYAANPNNLKDLKQYFRFVKGDICDRTTVHKYVKQCDIIVNFAAETHVDRAIIYPLKFIKTNYLGTYRLLEAARKFDISKFVQISTDEVYGSIEKGSFTEDDVLNPSNPYSASKAAADMLVQSYFTTYKLPVIITRSTNNFGPYQHVEKLIPKLIINALHNRYLPIYGDGLNVRDWLYVIDNCIALHLILQKGKNGHIYNIASENERTNLEVAYLILKYLKKDRNLIKFVKDRLGHDRRYSLNCVKLKKIGWKPKYRFENALYQTVKWYVKNKWWWQSIKEGKSASQV